MATRLSGLISGMDTESIIQQLVAVKQTKVDTKKGEQKKLSWVQDKWKELNSKLKSLMGTASNMRMSSAYAKKATKVSNSNAASVITTDKAVIGTQSLKIKQLAKTGYLTGAKIGNSETTALSTIDSLTGGSVGTGSFTIETGGKQTTVDISGSSTISDVLSKFQGAGLNASYDSEQNRIFISSKTSGKSNDFKITANDAAGSQALSALGLMTKSAYSDEYVANAAGDGIDEEATLAKYSSKVADSVAYRTSAYLTNYKGLLDSQAKAQEKIDEITAKYDNIDEDEVRTADYTELLSQNSDAIKAKKAEIEEAKKAGTDTEALEAELADLREETTKLKDLKTMQGQYTSMDDVNAKLEEAELNLQKDDAGNVILDADGNAMLTDAYAASLQTQAESDVLAYAAEAFAKDKADNDGTGFATKIEGQDAEIYLNGAKFTGSTNVFNINGLTITANQVTGDDEITLTTEQDTDAIYDMVKNYIKQYNEIINELDKLYNAESASKYTMLTDEERDAMSESEVEDWDNHIKASLLRGDGTVNTLRESISSIMTGGYAVNGKTMYLSDFGIGSLSYFTAADNEKKALHIDGDADDENTRNNEDKLKAMITSDPEATINFFTQLSHSLYSKMSSLSSSTNYRSYGSFYEDKRMATEYDDYKSKISELEEKLNAYEDSWYSKFSKMETAMAKMQQNASAITGIFGN